jgi:hypothetical protein
VKIESQQPQLQRQIEWRRSKVLELDSQGHSQPEIARTLQVSVGTVNRDLTCLREQSKQKIKKYIDEVLPNEYEKCLVGITSILKEAWNISNNTDSDKKEKIHALSLAKECYSMKLDLLTNATVVDDAIRFVSDYSSNNNNKHSISKQEENDSQESKEPSHKDEHIELEEEQEEETREMPSSIINTTTTTTTINQVF